MYLDPYPKNCESDRNPSYKIYTEMPNRKRLLVVTEDMTGYCRGRFSRLKEVQVYIKYFEL